MTLISDVVLLVFSRAISLSSGSTTLLLNDHFGFGTKEVTYFLLDAWPATRVYAVKWMEIPFVTPESEQQTHLK